jgi:proline iminopeptidase
MTDCTESLAQELEGGYTVTHYQQRGVAPSTLEGPFDVETSVSDAIAVMDAAGIEQAYLLGHSWGGHLAMYLAIEHQDRFLALMPIDPLGGVGPDGGAEDMGKIMDQRVGPEQAAKRAELDARAATPEGTPEDAVEALRIVWNGYFASPEQAVPMPEIQISPQCSNETFESIVKHFQAETLASRLGEVQLPTLFLLGADSPILPSHNIATAALMPNAGYQIDSVGHFVWMEQPGVVLRALNSLALTTV